MQVQTALILMTIMGCDDSTTHCVQLAETQPKWETVAACDAASEQELQDFTNDNYPVIVAICQSPATVATADATPGQVSADDKQAEVAKPAEDTSPKTLVDVLSRFADKTEPLTQGLKSIVIDKPVHVVKDSYSWVVRKIRD